MAVDQQCRVGKLPEAVVSLESLGQNHWLENSLSPGNVSTGSRWRGRVRAEGPTLLEIIFK